MTGIKIVDAIIPNLSVDKQVVATMNHERWFKVVNGVLNIPGRP